MTDAPSREEVEALVGGFKKFLALNPQWEEDYFSSPILQYVSQAADLLTRLLPYVYSEEGALWKAKARAALSVLNLPMEPDAVRLQREKMQHLDRAIAAELKLTEAEQRIGRLQEALKSVADLAGELGDGAPDAHYLAKAMLTIETSARAALTDSEGK